MAPLLTPGCRRPSWDRRATSYEILRNPPDERSPFCGAIRPWKRSGKGNEEGTSRLLCSFRTALQVGATGFEPATARPPAECATRLRHAPWCPSLRQVPSGLDANICSLWSFVVVVGAVAQSRSTTSRGVESRVASATIFAASADRRIRRSTTRRTGSATWTRRAYASGRLQGSERPSSSSTSSPTCASTAANRILSCSSSTISATSRLTWGRPCPIAAGSPSWRRLQSARSSARTATGAGPGGGEGHCERYSQATRARAGEGNRTPTERLEVSCAAFTPRPRVGLSEA